MNWNRFDISLPSFCNRDVSSVSSFVNTVPVNFNAFTGLNSDLEIDSDKNKDVYQLLRPLAVHEDN